MGMSLGQVVYSKAGRDVGKRFIVMAVIDQSYVLVCDGDLRRIEKPKKKKIKHLEHTGQIIEALNSKLESKLKVTNAEIRKALSALQENNKNTDG
ncbi:MAG TPA: KOW domain-containing RNA-binding protein [Clostridia bacterium]|nr:KOW domain-containing RNA-binding protein [Clostridia bacterium]